jgi:hypothetical protein
MSDNIIAQDGLNEAQRAVLSQRTPADVVKSRRGRGGTKLSYVSHDYVTRTLNQAFNWAWSFEVIEEKIFPALDAPEEIIVKGRLVVHAPGGDITKEQFGGASVKRTRQGDIISLADDFKAAASDALKKCASLLGVALDLYGDSPDVYGGGQPAPAPTNGRVIQGDGPKARFFRRVQTDLGLAVMRAVKIMRENGFDQYDEAKEDEMWALLQQFAEEKALPIEE